MSVFEMYIYIYAYSRRFYPKRLTVHSGYTFFCQYVCYWELNPQPFVLQTQCSTTEPQEQEQMNKWFCNKKVLKKHFYVALQ